MTTLTIVIPTAGNASLSATLTALKTAAQGLPVLVVANPHRSSIESLATAHGFGYLKCARGTNRARNAGWKAARRGWVYFLDDDVLPDAGLEARISSVLARHPLAKAVGGGYLLPTSAKPNAAVYHLLQRAWHDDGYRSSDQWTHLFGGNLLVRKESDDEPPPFDELLIFGATETETLEGWAEARQSLVRDSSLDLLHAQDPSILEFTRKRFRQGAGLAYATAKRPDLQRNPGRAVEGKTFSERWRLALARLAFAQGNAAHRATGRLDFSTLEILRRVAMGAMRAMGARWRLYWDMAHMEAFAAIERDRRKRR